MHKIDAQQPIKVSYTIYHNSCSEGSINFVQLPLHMNKPPLSNDIKIKLMLKCLQVANLQKKLVVSSNLL